MITISKQENDTLCRNANKWLDEIKKCTNGDQDILPEGFTVFRGDSNPPWKIEQNNGMIHEKRCEGNSLIEQARNQAKHILETEATCFVQKWKYSKDLEEKDEEFEWIRGCRTQMAGVPCGIEMSEKAGYDYVITVPIPLYVIGKNIKNNRRLIIFGDKDNLEDCSVLAMSMQLMFAINEFVFLTNVPLDWISYIE